MKDNWKEITDPEELFKLKREGWEIEVNTGPSWAVWIGNAWMNYMEYRARPRQPKMKKIKMMCWLDNGKLLWWSEENELRNGDWIRIPEQDIEIEVPDDN